MRQIPALFARAATLAVSPVLLFTLLQQSPSAPTPQPYLYRGTVQVVQPASLDLLTGVGYALRLIHVTTLPSTEVRSGAAALTFTEIRTGDIVRADCRMTPSGLVADRIERLAPSGSGPEAKP